MKHRFLILSGGVLLLALVGCQNPTASGTIEVYNDYTGTCTIWATLDGGTPVTIGDGSSYNFTTISPGLHNLTLHTAGNNGGYNCGYEGNSTYTTTCSVTVSGGVLYAATLLTGNNAEWINYTCPSN
jgi:hypothetical protein